MSTAPIGTAPMTRAHPLDPLLAPRSIAILGASTRPNSPGNDMVRMAKLDGFAGPIYPVNPKYREVEGLTCYPDLASLPGPVDHVLFGVANDQLEAQLDTAIRQGAKAGTIFANCVLEADSRPPLAARLAAKAKAAGFHLCGGNCMGFHNLPHRFRCIAFASPPDIEAGSIAFISQSGSTFSALANNDRRIKFSLCLSSGMELTTTVADYMDWALAQDETRVIGLFLETVRDPDNFVRAVARAAERRIPIVVLKVGRTEKSAAMALTHSGGLAGNDTAYQALFYRYGLLRVDTINELVASLLLFQQPKTLGPGGLATLHDSGGERELLVDLADDLGEPFAEIGSAAKAKLAARLDPGLTAENPVDAWGTGRDFDGVFRDCARALMDDPETAIGVLFANIRDGFYLSEGYAEAILAVAAGSDKPMAFATNYAMTLNAKLAKRLTDAGLPVMEGTAEALTAVRNMMAFRDFRPSPGPAVPAAPSATADVWRVRLGQGKPLGEAEGFVLLADYGISVPAAHLVTERAAALEAARKMGASVALKTAEDLAHKSDAGGVALNLSGDAAVAAAYDDLAGRLGPRVLVSEMVEPGVEIGLGVVNDPDFGPVVMVAARGVRGRGPGRVHRG